MKVNKPFIEEVIGKRRKEQDPPTEFATRNKASPLNDWFNFEPFEEESFNKIYNSINKVDGVKVKFKYVTVTFNGRHKNN